MGLFDKVKHFTGGHGVKIEHVAIEQQDPAAVQLPVGDTVVKGKFRVTSDKPCDVLSMKSEFCMVLSHTDGRVETVVLGSDAFPAPHCSRSDDMLKYPHTLANGASVEDFFIIQLETDILTALHKRNLGLPAAKFFVRTMVDVKGSPFDPEVKNQISVHG